MRSTVLETGLVVESQYRLDHWLGGGGMGVVWAATQLNTGQNVALKFLRPELAAELRTHERFLREARAAASVRHPNVVAVHEVLENDGFPAIVMDLLLGETLAKHLGVVGVLTLPETAAMLLPVISAIGAAHACGVVHRDLKPDNVFICSGAGSFSQRVRVLDFGIAKLMQREPGTASTQTGTLIGSPLYMSPEQVFCEGDIDHRADAWSLGVMLYECLAGVRPTRASSVGQTLKLITTGTIPPLAAHFPRVPSEVAHMVDALLSRDRSKRPELAAVRKQLRMYAPEDESPEFSAPVRLDAKGQLWTGGDTFLSEVDAPLSVPSTTTLSSPRRVHYPKPVPPPASTWQTADFGAAPPFTPAQEATVPTPTPTGRRPLMILGWLVAVTIVAAAGVRGTSILRSSSTQANARSSAGAAADTVNRRQSTVALAATPGHLPNAEASQAPSESTAVAQPRPPTRTLASASLGGAAVRHPAPLASSAPIAVPSSTARPRGALVEAPPF